MPHRSTRRGRTRDRRGALPSRRLWSVVRFDDDPEMVGLVEQLSPFARRWQPEDKSWRVATPYADRLAYGTDVHGCLITGLEPVPGTNPTRE